MRDLNRLPNSDMLDLLRISRAALDCESVDELRCRVLQELEQSFQCDMSVFYLSRSSSQDMDNEHVISRGIQALSLNQYCEHYHKLNPFPQRYKETVDVVTLDQIMPFHELLKTEYYNDFLKRQSMRYGMAIYLKARGELLGVVGLHRQENGFDFTSLEVAKAGMLGPFISRILEKTIAFENLLYARFASKGIHSHLTFSQKSRNGLRHPLLVLGLSKREVDVATLLCEGFKNREIAEELFISEHTVERHLSTIYEKSGVRNRTSLMRLVLALDRQTFYSEIERS